ncbi:hypothetical protein WN944_008388 [Citrus x changshan-huyou]
MGSHGNIVMMKQVAVAIALFLVVHSPSPTNAMILDSPSKLVDGVCKKTLNYADCVSAIGSASASDLKTLARVSLERAVSNTTNSKDYIDKLAKDKSTAPALIRALKECVSDYESSAASFKSAKMEIDEDISSANYDAKVAGDGADSCDTSLKATKKDVPSVKARNYYVKLYSNIGFVITEQLGG